MGLGLSNSATADQFHIFVHLLMGLLLVSLYTFLPVTSNNYLILIYCHFNLRLFFQVSWKLLKNTLK